MTTGREKQGRDSGEPRSGLDLPVSLLRLLPLLYGVVFVPGAVAASKGHGLWLLLDFFFTPLLWWFASFRLAPGFLMGGESLWQSRFCFCRAQRQRAM